MSTPAHIVPEWVRSDSLMLWQDGVGEGDFAALTTTCRVANLHTLPGTSATRMTSRSRSGRAFQWRHGELVLTAFPEVSAQSISYGATRYFTRRMNSSPDLYGHGSSAEVSLSIRLTGKKAEKHGSYAHRSQYLVLTENYNARGKRARSYISRMSSAVRLRSFFIHAPTGLHPGSGPVREAVPSRLGKGACTLVCKHTGSRFARLKGFDSFGRIPSVGLSRALHMWHGEDDKGRSILSVFQAIDQRVATYKQTTDPNWSPSRAEKLHKLHQLLEEPLFLAAAYDQIKSNQAGLTPASTPLTLDGLVPDKDLEEMAAALAAEQFTFSPGRRTGIPKKSGKTRYITVVAPRDKMILRALYLILVRIYEPLFVEESHGFRPGKGRQSAIGYLQRNAQSMHYTLNGDIGSCFPIIKMEKVMEELDKLIGDQKFLRLMRKVLKTGYVEFSDPKKVYSSNLPQAPLAPLLANVVLHRLDLFVRRVIDEDTLGTGRRPMNPEYRKLKWTLEDRRRSVRLWQSKVTTLEQQENPDSTQLATCRERLGYHLRQRDRVRKRMVATLPTDPQPLNYRRLCYVRYADDFVIFASASHKYMNELKVRIAHFLKQELGLTLNLENTTIVNVNKQEIPFLGFSLRHYPSGRSHLVRQVVSSTPYKRRLGAGNLGIKAPVEALVNRLKDQGLMKTRLKAKDLPALSMHPHETIVNWYSQFFAGYLNYYRGVTNFSRMASHIGTIVRKSCARTLARKYKSSATQMFRRFGVNLQAYYLIPIVRGRPDLNGFSKRERGLIAAAVRRNQRELTKSEKQSTAYQRLARQLFKSSLLIKENPRTGKRIKQLRIPGTYLKYVGSVHKESYTRIATPDSGELQQAYIDLQLKRPERRVDAYQRNVKETADPERAGLVDVNQMRRAEELLLRKSCVFEDPENPCQERVELHHIRRVEYPKVAKKWEAILNRKHIPVCAHHHRLIHRGAPEVIKLMRQKVCQYEKETKAARTVQRLWGQLSKQEKDEVVALAEE